MNAKYKYEHNVKIHTTCTICTRCTNAQNAQYVVKFDASSCTFTVGTIWLRSKTPRGTRVGERASACKGDGQAGSVAP
jgi:hypothetical protein